MLKHSELGIYVLALFNNKASNIASYNSYIGAVM